jgi:hypothetical protein
MGKKPVSRKVNKAKNFHNKSTAVSTEKRKRVSEIKPVWNADNLTLWWNVCVVIEFRRRCAPSLELFLTNFQELGWRRLGPTAIKRGDLCSTRRGGPTRHSNERLINGGGPRPRSDMNTRKRFCPLG